MAWELKQRLLVLRMPPIDREGLAQYPNVQRKSRVLNWSSCCAPNGSTLFAIAHVPNVWPLLSKEEQRTWNDRARLKCKEAWEEEPPEVMAYFEAQTSKVRGGSLDAVYEVLDRFKKHQQPKVNTPVAGNAHPTSGMMSFLRRTELIEIAPFDVGAVLDLSPGKQDARVRGWVNNNVNATGITLWALKIAPDYERAVAAKKYFRPSSYAQSRWAKLDEESRARYATASVQLHDGGLATFLRVTAQILGPLPDLTPVFRTHSFAETVSPVTTDTTSMSFRDRVALAGLSPLTPKALAGMTRDQQDVHVMMWCRANLRGSGQSLFALKKAPEYMTSDNRERQPLLQWSQALWARMGKEQKRSFKAASNGLQQNGCTLELFVQVMTQTLGPLPDIAPLAGSVGNHGSVAQSSPSATSTPAKGHTSGFSPSNNVESRDLKFRDQKKRIDQEESKAQAAAAVANFGQWISQAIEASVASTLKGTRVIKPMKSSKTTTADSREVPSNFQTSDQPICQANELKRVDSAIGSSVSSDYLSAKSSPEPSTFGTPRAASPLKTEQPNNKSQPKLKAEATATQTTVLDKLVPRQIRSDDSDELIEQILEALKKRVFPRANKILVGRTSDHLRIDYNPMAPDITGISSRLHTAAMSENVSVAFEALLRPLAEWNASTMFSELKGFGILYANNNGGASAYRSAWALHGDVRRKVSPIKIDHAWDVIEPVYDSIRARFRGMKGDESLHLLELEKYLDQLGDCFDGPEATPEHYDDQVERVLYRFEMEQNLLGVL